MKNKLIATAYTVLAIVVLAAPLTFGTFAVLRLCHVINWSWWLVTLPLWGVLLLAISFVIASSLILFAVNGLIGRKKASEEFRTRKGDAI